MGNLLKILLKICLTALDGPLELRRILTNYISFFVRLIVNFNLASYVRLTDYIKWEGGFSV